MDDAYGRVGHRLAEVVAEEQELQERLTALARERLHLEQRLAEFIRHERFLTARSEQQREQAERNAARLELRDERELQLELADTVRFRVPDFVVGPRESGSMPIVVTSSMVKDGPGGRVRAADAGS